MAVNSQQVDNILEVVRTQIGTDLTGYSRSVLSRRIEERLTHWGMDVSPYISLCRSDTKECATLADTLAIHVSSFFRNPIVFEILAQSVLPRLMEEKDDIRVWSAGCAAGEEPYSVSILIQEEIRKSQRTNIHPMVFATDIDRDILKAAEKAHYPRESLNDTRLGLVNTYFSSDQEGFQLSSDVIERVHFSAGDLLSKQTGAPAESIFGSFDLILCRNVLIYFTEAKQKQILQRLYASLAKGGTLVLGDSETLYGDLKTRFRTVDARNRIYQK
jgi:chemotaxis protein methyltransferase CheR